MSLASSQVLAELCRARFASEDADEVAALCAELTSLARSSWPALAVDANAFGVHLLTVLSGAGRDAGRDAAATPGSAVTAADVVVRLSSLRAADVYLAFACAAKDGAALAAFEETFGSEFRTVHARVRGPKPELADFTQECRRKLFLQERPKIADYSGTGDLRNFLRVTLTRTLIDMSRAGRFREVPAGDDFEAIAGTSEDPELDYLKRTYREEFKLAFEEAARALDAEDRNMLRQHFVDALTIDQLAHLHGVHRATAARRVAKAREGLLREVRQRLMAKLRVGRDELDSVMRYLESGLSLSLGRVLGTG